MSCDRAGIPVSFAICRFPIEILRHLRTSSQHCSDPTVNITNIGTPAGQLRLLESTHRWYFKSQLAQITSDM